MSDQNDNYMKKFVQGFNPLAFADAVSASGKEDQEKRLEMSGKMPTAVSLPDHLFIPRTGQSVDIRRLANVLPATSTELIVFTAPPGQKTKFIGYGVFSDALLFNLVNFIPTVNGKRIFPFHGDPQVNYKIALGVAPDLSNNAMINCQLDMNPGEVLKWTFFNNDVVAVAAGVRMVGYVDVTVTRTAGRFGG